MLVNRCNILLHTRVLVQVPLGQAGRSRRFSLFIQLAIIQFSSQSCVFFMSYEYFHRCLLNLQRPKPVAVLMSPKVV